MTINERIRTLRKDILHLNQRQFAAELGMAQTGISGIEQKNATVTDRTIKMICSMYNLNENWLRNGQEPIYLQAPQFRLDEFVKERGGTEFEIEIMKAYFELDPEIREKLVDHFRSHFAKSQKKEAAYASTDDAEAAYIKSRSNSARKETSSASNTTTEREIAAAN